MIDEREWKTRRDRINTRLKAINPAWKIVKYKPDLETSALECHAVEEFPTANGPADYALFIRGRLLGIIEAKKVGVGIRVLDHIIFNDKGYYSFLEKGEL